MLLKGVIKLKDSIDAVGKLLDGNRRYLSRAGNAEIKRRVRNAEEGQHPYAIVVTCSDSRVIPEKIFSADLGDLFVIRVAGNVIGEHEAGSAEYAAGHLHVKHVVVLGHTQCGAVGAALEGDGEGFVRSITDEIKKAIGDEKDYDGAVRQNVRYGVRVLSEILSKNPETGDVNVCGAVYDVKSGLVTIIDRD
ncbi:MAG: carbonic anhydrase [Clostridia bacterium]|nr:carbonic anhydrase [Clostridia bacterium]